MRHRLALAFLLGLLLVLPGSAGAAQRPVDVAAERVRLTAPVAGRAALLAPIRYPIEMSGRVPRLRLILHRPGGRPIATRMPRQRVHGGSRGRPERRIAFRFVHRIDLGRRLTRRLRRGRVRVRVVVRAALTGGGGGDHATNDRETQTLPRRYAAAGLCASVPHLRVRPGARVVIRLPLCGAPTRWRLARGPDSRPRGGVARIRGGRLIYRSAQRFRGTESIGLRSGRASAGAGPRSSSIQLTVAAGKPPVVRAIGDSVTAGFGYYDNGAPMPFTSLFSCKPAATFYNDACSSNSSNRSNTVKEVRYAPDYGLANNVSWVAQWANAHGVTDYANLAVTGSEPANWLPGGQLYATTQRLEGEDPDYVLMTMGANPLLSDMLFGIDNMGCAIWSDLTGKYRECIEEAFRGVDLRGNLERLYRELIAKTKARIYLMQYHLSVPSVALAYSSTQIAMMGALLNGTIAAVAGAVDPSGSRLRVLAPPHFNVGVDIGPVYPSRYSCSRFDFKVDGRSVQSNPTQDFLLALHPLSFCKGPAEGPPWVISGDTGIHPSAAGYAQMAARVPAP